MEKTLYMIGNAHIDPVWLWRWQEGMSEIRATFRSALDRLDEYPGFIFTSAAAAYYEWVERNDPDMFSEIQWRVAEGRWALVGGWWVQPDCNLPSGESFARQALYGQRYFREKFGIMARTGYNVDSFGHSGALPKILRMSGMDRYVFMRPDSQEMALPAPLFTWESPEGAAVTAFRLTDAYCTGGAALEKQVGRCAAQVRDGRGLMCFYGVGNHGGGPTKENIESILNLGGAGETTLFFSSPDRYFNQALAQADPPLPTVTGDLLHHASGCYAAHSGIKQWNRQAENRLLTAEKWSVLAHLLLEMPYPKDRLEAAWKKLLFNQFHDILAGTSILQAYEDARADLGFALSTADAVIDEAQQAMMRMIGIRAAEGERPFVAFNPQAFAAHWPVTLDCAAIDEGCVLLDDGGKTVPYQALAPSAATRGRQRITFLADLPAMGYRVYRLAPRPGHKQARPLPIQGDLTLENKWIRAAFSPETGGLASLLWKPSNTQMLRASGEALRIRDDSDTWSHGVLRFDEVKGPMALQRVERIAEGESCATVRVTLAHEGSLLVQEYTLYHDLPRLFVHVQVNWQERQTALKLRFPLALHSLHITAQGPFGYADRPANGEEYPMQQWVDATGTAGGGLRTGLAILNDAKYAYDVHDRAIHLTVLRSPYYAHHNPFVVEQGAAFPVTDQGWQSFTYVLMPHDGSAQEANVDREAALLAAPPTLLPEGFHAGSWPQARALVRLEGDSVQLDALKLAEDGSGDLIVHLHETARRTANAVLTLVPLRRRIPLQLAPGEIRALCIPRDDAFPPEQVNLLELPLDKA